MTEYKNSGVDIELGDSASEILYNAAKETWKNRKGKLGEVIVPFDDFSGIRAIDISNLQEGTLMNISFDGVGTKIEIAERTNNHKTIAYDLIAMVCDDAVVRGAEPVLVGSILDVNSLGKGNVEKIKEIAYGYINAANEANVAVINGEMAELGNRVKGYGEFNYNWGAAVVWFARKERMFTGYEIKNNDFLVGFRENGFRSNGLSLVRRIMKDLYGEEWHKEEYNNKNFGEVVLEHSKIYTRAVVEMFGGYEKEPKVEIHGVAHITGGGIPGKLGRVLKPSGSGAVIDSPFEPTDLMLYCQEKGNVSDKEAYRTWNMGNGMIIITPKPDDIIRIAKKYEIDAKIIGKISSDNSIKIRNMGYNKNKEYLIF